MQHPAGGDAALDGTKAHERGAEASWTGRDQPRNGPAVSKKNLLKPWRKVMWCIGHMTHEYRKRMYHLLALYARAYDPLEPVICVDEKSKQLLESVRPALTTRPGLVRKEDYEYRRRGTCNLFVAVEPGHWLLADPAAGTACRRAVPPLSSARPLGLSAARFRFSAPTVTCRKGHNRPERVPRFVPLPALASHRRSVSVSAAGLLRPAVTSGVQFCSAGRSVFQPPDGWSVCIRRAAPSWFRRATTNDLARRPQEWGVSTSSKALSKRPLSVGWSIGPRNVCARGAALLQRLRAFRNGEAAERRWRLTRSALEQALHHPEGHGAPIGADVDLGSGQHADTVEVLVDVAHFHDLSPQVVRVQTVGHGEVAGVVCENDVLSAEAPGRSCHVSDGSGAIAPLRVDVEVAADLGGPEDRRHAPRCAISISPSFSRISGGIQGSPSAA